MINKEQLRLLEKCSDSLCAIVKESILFKEYTSFDKNTDYAHVKVYQNLLTQHDKISFINCNLKEFSKILINSLFDRIKTVTTNENSIPHEMANLFSEFNKKCNQTCSKFYKFATDYID